ncbi:uncharacterized protein LOC143225419 [Tachypleus tridentatus]|uniref:uncharacterized protein LOC143225419 n=1 Tax=Tachypleus tridentatus TaxID=6853 RepID=UPI003FD25FA8
MELLKIKVEPFHEDTLLDTKLVESEETFTQPVKTEDDSWEDISSFTSLRFDVSKQKEEEENSDGTTEKDENTVIKVKTEQSDDLPQDEVISKFSYCSDDVLDSAKYSVMNVKTETEFKEHLQQTEFRLESTSDINTCCRSHFSGNHVLRKEDSLREVPKPNSDVCGKTNLSENNLNEFDIHEDGSKPYNQIICGQDLGMFNNITQQNRINTGENFVRNSPIKNHQRTHTAKILHSFTVCRKQFETNEIFKIHQRIHTDKKCYSCSVCEKQFGTDNELKLHERIHSVGKPYYCTVCGKQFRNNSILKIHQRIHTGERPYSCEVCGKQFGTNSNLKTHLSVHTGGETLQL